MEAEMTMTKEQERRVVEALNETARSIEKHQNKNWFGNKEKEAERDNMLQFLYLHQANLSQMLKLGET